MNLVLVGQRASGKTAAGEGLAARIKATYIDTDHEVEKAEGRSIPAIFSEEGEGRFREAEKKVIHELCLFEDSIISTGGGAPLDPANREDLRAAGKVVWLDALPETLLRRRRVEETRPPLTDLPLEGEIARLYEERRPAYEACAHLRIETDDLDLEEVIRELERIWRSVPHSHLR